jgi:hypothetical protein
LLVVSGCVKTSKYGALSTSIFSILPGRDNRAMHNDCAAIHIFDERSQTPHHGIAGFDSDAAVGPGCVKTQKYKDKQTRRDRNTNRSNTWIYQECDYFQR